TPPTTIRSRNRHRTREGSPIRPNLSLVGTSKGGPTGILGSDITARQDRTLKIPCRSTDSFCPQEEWETTTLRRLLGTKQRHGEKQVPPSANGSSLRTSERGNCFHQIRSTRRILPDPHT